MRDIVQVFKAVISAMIGVGKKTDLAKDFEKTENQGPWPYIIVGLIMTMTFIGLVLLSVKLVLS